jgi:hypothetical protein
MTDETVWRSAWVLGVGGLLCGLFRFVESIQYRLVRVDGWSLMVLLVLSGLAIAAGVLRHRLLLVGVGGGFLIAAGLQLIAWAGSNWLGGDGSTVSLFAGFGVGLLALGMTPLPESPAGR